MQYKTETPQEALQHTVVHCDSLVFYCKQKVGTKGAVIKLYFPFIRL